MNWELLLLLSSLLRFRFSHPLTPSLIKYTEISYLYYRDNSVEKLKPRLPSRFAVVKIKPYDLEEFKKVTLDVLKKHPLAEYIAEQVYQSSNPNIRDCVRIAAMARTEQDVLRTLRILK